MPDFFVSRNRADKAWAEWLAWQLEAAGYTTVVQDWDFRPGSNFVLKMQEATTSAKRTIAVLSPDFLKSAYTAPEWAAAFAGDPTGVRNKLVPVRVRPCEPAGLLGQVVRIDLVDLDETEAKAELLRGVRARRAKPSKAPPFPGKGPGKPPAFPGQRRPGTQQRAQATRTRGEAKLPSQVLSAKEIVARIDGHRWGERPDRARGGWTGDAWLGAVLVPDRQGIPYVDVLALGRPELRDQVLGLALVGPTAIFRTSRPTEDAEKADHRAFEQRDERTRGLVAALEVHTDGTLVYRTAVERRTQRASRSLADTHVIDEDAVRRAVAAFVAFANAFYKRRRRDPGNLNLGISLSGIAHKHFGRLPDHEVSSFTIGSPRVEDPLRVPGVPLRIAKTQLAKPDTVAKTAVEHVARAFRLEGAYYSP